MNEDLQKRIIQKKENGMSIAKIAAEEGIYSGTVSKFLKSQGISTARNPIIKNMFHSINNEEKAYWLGFLYADGSVSKYNQIGVELQASDVGHLEKLKKFLNTNTKISIGEVQSKNKIYKRCRLFFCSKEMAQDLANLGCTNKKSLTLTFPTKEQVPDEFLYDFIRGYCDGDGSLINTEKTYCLNITSTKTFLDGMIERTGWKDCKRDPHGKAESWRITAKANVHQYLEQMYGAANIYLDRKYELYKAMIAV